MLDILDACDISSTRSTILRAWGVEKVHKNGESGRVVEFGEVEQKEERWTFLFSIRALLSQKFHLDVSEVSNRGWCAPLLLSG